MYIIMLYSFLEIECLLRDGMIYVEFKYAWHSLLPSTETFHDNNKLQRVEDCLKHGANPSNRGGPGLTALMLTCKNLNNFGLLIMGYSTEAEQLVSLLLEHGDEVNQQDFYGRTALHYAFESRYDDSYLLEESLALRQRVVQILIQHNADIYLKDSSGLSAIDMAKREGHESWLRTDEASLTGTCSEKRKRSCSEEN
jgi:ankyrin repeat protein